MEAQRDRVAELEQQLQAVIAERDRAICAITDLNASLRSAQDRQSATGEILRAVANSLGDAEEALKQIADTTARLFGGQSVRIRLVEGGAWGLTIGVGASAQRIVTELTIQQLSLSERNLQSAVVLENRQVHIPDLDDVDPSMSDWPGLPPARAAGTRTMAGTPLRRDGKAIGVLVVYRDRLAPFTSDELNLLQSFADQAVIAIENARLFDEVQQRTLELAKSLDDLRTAQDRLVRRNLLL